MAQKYSPDLSDWWMHPHGAVNGAGDDGEGTRDGVERERNEAWQGAWLVGVQKGTFTLST